MLCLGESPAVRVHKPRQPVRPLYSPPIEFDWLTIAVLTGVVYGPINAWQAAAQPAKPWSEVGTGIRALVIGGLALTVVAIVVLVAIGRPILAALLAVSAAASYLLARSRRARLHP